MPSVCPEALSDQHSSCYHGLQVILQQVTSPSFVSTIESFTQKFDQHLGDFMRRLYEDSRAQLNHSHLANLCTRLDYNGYLSRTYGLKVDD